MLDRAGFLDRWPEMRIAVVMALGEVVWSRRAGSSSGTTGCAGSSMDRIVEIRSGLH